MGMPGLPEWIIILAVVLLLFGSKKLPALGGALGESIKNFKQGINSRDEEASPDEEDSRSAIQEINP
jgi:sec-independent protein translocase protein TatA